MGVRVDSVAAELVQDYFERSQLAKLGITTDLSTLTTWEVDALIVISQSINKTLEDERKKLDKKLAKRKGR